MRAINHKLRMSTAILLAMVLGSYVFSSDADAAEGRDISRVNRGISVAEDERVGDVSSVNGGIQIERGANAGEVSTVNGSIQLESNAVVYGAETVNGGIRVGESVTINGSLLTVNGGIRTSAGTVVEDEVRTINGRVRLYSTQVGANVETSNGDIDLRDGSTVEGDIVVKANRSWWNRIFNSNRREPEITIDESSSVLGTIHLYRPADLNIADGAQVGEIVEHY